MRYPADHKALTRARILQAAATVFRRRGFAGAGVDEVMAEASLTAGGFYAHFKSKDELLAATIEQALQSGTILRGKADEGVTGAELIRRILAKYLSPQHRQALEQGCVMPPLLAELARQEPQARARFEAELLDVVETLSPHWQGAVMQEKTQDEPPALQSADERVATDQTLAMLATMIGGMTLARAVADEALADRILAACRALVQPPLRDVKHKKKSSRQATAASKKPAATKSEKQLQTGKSKKHSQTSSSSRSSGATKR